MMDQDTGFEIHTEKLKKNMKEEFEELKSSHPNNEELEDFFNLYKRFIKCRNEKISWDKIKPLSDKLIEYKDLKPCEESNHELLSKLAVLKLNGGLGTTMGMVGPKSAITIKEGKNFIDLIVSQLEFLNKKYNCSVPLVLMNSFNTDNRTKKLTKHYDNIKSFCQSMYPRISAENFLPIFGNEMWYPPGHGDIFQSLSRSGMLDELLNEGKEYLFVSNIDNLAATVDLNILQHFAKEDLDFCMEVTNKTRADIKGGTLIRYENALTLLEIAQVPTDKKSEFTSTRKFKIFNTNSVWINLKTLKSIISEKDFQLDIIQNKKIVNGEVVIQLETALGAAIKFFKKNCGVIVPRTRFLPVKTCSDLFLLESNLFTVENGFLTKNKNRTSNLDPIIKLLGKNFSKITEFDASFESIPDIIDLDILTVVGDVRFGKNIVLKGIVIIIAPAGSSISIPDGSILDDKIMFGNLPMTDI